MILSERDLRNTAPAIFSDDHAMSSRYAQVATSELLRILGTQGYFPVQAKQDNAKRRDPRYVMHSVVLRHESHIDKQNVIGDSVPQILLVNSHNGRSQLRMRAGLYRFVCANGLVVGDTTMSATVPHRGDARAEALGFAQTMAETSDRLARVVKQWSNITLTSQQRLAFAKEAAELRFGPEGAKSFETRSLLEARREEDNGVSLWRVFNVLQENTVKGGLRGMSADGRQTTTRALNAIQASANYNARLWDIASRYAGAAA